MDREERRRKLESTRCAVYVQQRHWWKKREIENERRARREKVRGEKGGGNEMVEAHEGSSPCMAASSTYRLPLTGCTIAIASTFFAPPPTCLSSTRILHLQGGVTLKTLPVLNYSVPLSFSLSSSSSSTSFYPSFSASSLRQTSSPPSRFSPHLSVFVSILPSLVFVFFIFFPLFYFLIFSFFTFLLCFVAFQSFVPNFGSQGTDLLQWSSPRYQRRTECSGKLRFISVVRFKFYSPRWDFVATIQRVCECKWILD